MGCYAQSHICNKICPRLQQILYSMVFYRPGTYLHVRGTHPPILCARRMVRAVVYLSLFEAISCQQENATGQPTGERNRLTYQKLFHELVNMNSTRMDLPSLVLPRFYSWKEKIPVYFQWREHTPSSLIKSWIAFCSRRVSCGGSWRTNTGGPVRRPSFATMVAFCDHCRKY